VQQRWRSRAQTQHEGGSRDLYSDHEGRAWARGTLWPRAGDNYSGKNLSPPPSPPTRALRTEHPPTPFQRAHPTPSTSTTGGQPRRKHTSASGTRSEAMGWARGGWGDHCELFSCFLGGKTAELVARAEWPARYLRALPSRWMEDPWQASTTRQVKGRPVRDRSLYKESPCTFPPLSKKTRRWPHLQTHREETLPTRSEEEQTVVKTLQAKQLRRSSSLRL